MRLDKPHQTSAWIRAGEGCRLLCGGAWTAEAISGLGSLPDSFCPGHDHRHLILDASGVEALDTAGACRLVQLQSELQAAGDDVVVTGLPRGRQMLLDEAAASLSQVAPPPPPVPGGMEELGRAFTAHGSEIRHFLAFFGEVMLRLLGACGRPHLIRWAEVRGNVYAAGCGAISIVGLLSFLMGVVITYQGAVQLRVYGASIYVADLVSLSLLRELAPLLTAIIIAGRTGSAYAAQIGTMQVSEEISALQTIGVSTLDMLVIPKTLALIFILPLLSVFADILGVLGGMVMAKVQLDIGFAPFLDRIAEAVSLRSFLIGVCKAPLFAGIIAIVGCYQGMRVSGGAESVGRHTTLAVVQAIFLVVVADALFSVTFSALGM